MGDMRNKKQIDLTKPIVMVGLMGAGKTSVGRGGGRNLKKNIVDSEKEIENRCLLHFSHTRELYHNIFILYTF